jgi:hypothetical protein
MEPSMGAIKTICGTHTGQVFLVTTSENIAHMLGAYTDINETILMGDD